MAQAILSRSEAKASGQTNYFTGIPCKHGHVTERNTKSRGCLGCLEVATIAFRRSAKGKEYFRRYNRQPKVKAYQSNWMAMPEHKDRMRKLGRERRVREHAKLGSKAWSFSSFRHAKERSDKFGLPFDAHAVMELLANPPTHCPVFGWEMKPGGVRRDDSPSLDRLRPELGYVRGNIALISFKANRIKTNATAAEVRAVADWLESV